MRNAESPQAAVRVERIVTTSLEDCDRRLNASMPFVRHDQMGEGAFAAEVARLLGPRGMKVSAAAYDAPVTSIGASPDRTYAFCLPVSNPAGAYWNHHPIRADEVAILRPGGEFRLYRPAGFRSVVLRIDEGVVERRCEALLGLPPSRVLGGTGRLAAGEGAVAACARHFAQICAAASKNPKPLNDWAAAHGGTDGLDGEFLEEILTMVLDPTRMRGWSTRQRIVDRAWKAIDDDEEKASVGDLCMKLGVPIRTLDEAFRECLGMTPKRFILGVQLNKVRRQLTQPDDETTVTGTATRYGFYHFGHFGAQYRRLFGESAQQTLARGRAEARGLRLPSLPLPFLH